MITFNEFLEHKRVESTITECAHRMVEMNVDPYEYIHECLKGVDPVLAEGFWDGVANFAKNVGTGVKQFFGNVGQGARAGYNQASDTVAGPTAKFAAAKRALQDLQKVLERPEFNDFQSGSGRGSVAKYISEILSQLETDEKNMPQRTDTKIDQRYATSGEVKNQRAAANAPQQPSAMDMSRLSPKPQQTPTMDMSKLSGGAPAGGNVPAQPRPKPRRKQGRPPMRRTGTTGP
jgi:hypothetical protein